MLGLRTKQINTYGKRAKRVIDAPSSSGTTKLSTEILSIFEDMPAPPPWKNVAAKMKKRENEIPKLKGLSPKVVGLQKKKRLSPVLSPIRKKQSMKVAESRSLMAAIFDGSAATTVKPATKVRLASPSRPTNPASGLSPASPRPPLSSVSINITASPAVMQRPLKLKKPSPLVNVDIIVLDDNGRTISQERRVSKGNVTVNTISKISTSRNTRNTSGKHKSVPHAVSDTEEELGFQPLRRPTRHVARKKMVVSSEEEISEQEHLLTPKPRKPPQHPKPSRRIVEVSIPPAPYKVHRPAVQAGAAMLSPQGASLESSMPLPPSPITDFRLTDTPSPAFKPRQLTPIQVRHKRTLYPPSPPSPATMADLDLSIDFSEFNLDATANDFQAPEYLKPLLTECHQETCGPHNFSGFIETFPSDPILRSWGKKYPLDLKFKKIGEASFSEVFGIGDVVLKIIPLCDELRTNQSEEVEGPAPSNAQDVRKEIIVTRAMGEVYGGFIKLLKTYVVKGRYPEVLLRLWDEYNEQRGSESVRPDTFKVSQLYAIIVLPNGGPDLEAYAFHSAIRSGWRQACSLFWQVAKSLAHAEHLVSFEHRDLHWGQILVKNLPSQANALKSLNANQKLKSRTCRVYMDDRSHGVQATIIDLGLSRMDAGDGSDGERVHWTPFDDEVFMGEGDYQFDVYRMMKEFSRSKWDGFYPFTNVLWLHYLLSRLLRFKALKPPAIPRRVKGSETPAPPTSETAFSERDCYDCLVDMENWLEKTIAGLFPSGGKALKGGRGKRKTQVLSTASSSSSGPARAGEIVAYGVKKGWIQNSVLF